MDTFISNSPEETFGLGRRWAAELRPGWVVGLIGDLGTGKTQLVKGIAAGLGIAGTVTSPTFALLQEHDDGTLPLAHIDLYRLESQQEIVGAGRRHRCRVVRALARRRLAAWPTAARAGAAKRRPSAAARESFGRRRNQAAD